ncbi:MAG: sugar phosphate nucleotidyltransferase [Chthoniobacterales bacterium]
MAKTPSKIRNLHVCILAGGSGERFWPMSRTDKPKHLLRLLTEKTMLEETVRRIATVIPLKHIRILTNQAQLKNTRIAVPQLPAENIIAEPCKRDTAPAAALATALAYREDPDAICAVFPADAMIHDDAAFGRNLRDALYAVQKFDAFAVFSIPPTHPSTGFGYVELSRSGKKGPEGSSIFEVLRFVEKPDLAKAKRYLKSKKHGWNAGMFLWKASHFLEEADRLQPVLASFIRKFPKGNPTRFLRTEFEKLPKISVDYAIMEKANKVVAVKAQFDWDDVGTWTALPAHLDEDHHGNTKLGAMVSHDAKNNITISTGRMIALCGVEDLVVVETHDAVLVCKRSAVQDVKKLQPHLPDHLR